MMFGVTVTDPAREVYPNAPLVLVATEVRHPAAEPLNGQQQAALKRALAKEFPLSNPATITKVTQVVGGPPQVTQSTAPRFTSRDRTTSITYHAGALVLETTRYAHFERLTELLMLAVAARLEVGELDGLERVGLRYIDEIRVPNLGDIDEIRVPNLGDIDEGGTGWDAWLDRSLLGPAPIGGSLGLHAGQWQGLVVFNQVPTLGTDADTKGSDSLVLRYGPGEGYALDPGGELKRPTPPPGPFFLLDIDSFWTSGSVVPPLDPQELASTAARLHDPVRGLFESLITERLREAVLRDAN